MGNINEYDVDPNDDIDPYFGIQTDDGLD